MSEDERQQKQEWNERGERMYPDYIKESQAAYKATGNPALGRMLAKKQGEYTVEDYYALPEDCRVELIDGVIYNMAAPTWTHQGIIGSLYYQLRSYIERNRGECLVRLSPCDVELGEDDKTVVQPDLFVLCRKRDDLSKDVSAKRRKDRDAEKNPKLAPDLVIEVLSPSTRSRDRKIKYEKYKQSGVREYWIINPKRQRVDVYIFEKPDASMASIAYGFDEKILVYIYEGECVVTLSGIQQEIELQEEFGYY